MRFRDREHAGDVLANLVSETVRDVTDGIVLGLPRGGVPVAARVATFLGLPLDVFLVRKLGLPGHEELAMGAIATGGVRVLNNDVLTHYGIAETTVDKVAAYELVEIQRRERLYRGDRPTLDLGGRDVILVDDGIATGASIRAAIKAVAATDARSVVVAVPVAPVSWRSEMPASVDELIVVQTPEPFSAVGWWYRDFTQTTDGEVQELLAG